jgi:dinuclear metal center YbgI/SA1388 family protein
VTTLVSIAAYLDDVLRTQQIPDYDEALNGIQLPHVGPVRRVAAAVDFSLTTVQRAVAGGANMLLVHHGMYWGGPRALIGPAYERLRLLIAHDTAVYASHLPLDLHPGFGNNALLARELQLIPDGGFGRFRDIEIGCSGSADIATTELFDRVRAFAKPLGSSVVCTTQDTARRTRHWAIVTGAGASNATLREAADRGIDTLIVGEGPHHSAVDAMERDIAVIYGGHYATETLGVRALATEIDRVFGVPWFFIDAPTGL